VLCHLKIVIESPTSCSVKTSGIEIRKFRI
jgi:hypothetical protein